jgi:tRNA(Ile)-lysidine synthase
MVFSKSIADVLTPYLENHHFLVGLSGGLDSIVLLHLLDKIRDQNNVSLNFSAIHIHHGLSPHGDEWSEFCKSLCTRLNIHLDILKVNARNQSKESPEAAARKARYQAIRSFMDEHTILLTGHHQDDQAETLLVQLLRGAGIKGLASMPVVKSFGKGLLIRPMLFCSRTSILEYAKEHQLRWIEDESNLNLKFDRNFIRHKVMPLLKSRWPSAAKTLARAAENCVTKQQQKIFLKKQKNGFYLLKV